MGVVRIVGCIPTYREGKKSKLSEIERMIIDSNADILLLPEEYFGGPSSTGKFETFSTDSRLFSDISELANAYSCGIVVGLIENKNRKKFQGLWFFNEKGEHVGTERKNNLARYEIFHYGLSSIGGFNRQTYSIKGTKGTGIFCWEIHDIRSRVACDEIAPDWIVNAIKFPPDCLTNYLSSGSERILKGMTSSQEIYAEWLGKIKFLASDLITLVIASCGTDFALGQLPIRTQPIACIVHPDNKVSADRFYFGPKSKTNSGKGLRKGGIVERETCGTIALTNMPGSFVCFDFRNDISLLRKGRRFYEAEFGEAAYPIGISVSVRAWQLRHFGKIQ